MATYTPPPYFPQGSLAPPDQRRYRKFKLLMAALCVLILLVVAGLGFGVYFLVTRVF